MHWDENCTTLVAFSYFLSINLFLKKSAFDLKMLETDEKLVRYVTFSYFLIPYPAF